VKVVALGDLLKFGFRPSGHARFSARGGALTFASRQSNEVLCFLRSSSVLFVADVFHPVGGLSVERFLKGNMGHGSRRHRAVPFASRPAETRSRRKPPAASSIRLRVINKRFPLIVCAASLRSTKNLKSPPPRD
jgi:hypothetical protein